jgi:thiamine-phosphate pyrophosphorylase
MASALERERLARAARALNERAGARELPALILMTDQARLSDPASAARLLPRGSAVILRHTDAGARATLARALAAIAPERGLRLLIAGDPQLVARIGADGLHLPETRGREAAYWRALRPNWLITVAAHSVRGLAIARLVKADAALLAPAFPTSSHPGRLPLGPLKVRMMSLSAGLPVYALGGINARSVARLKDARLAGIAAIDGLLADQSA